MRHYTTVAPLDTFVLIPGYDRPARIIELNYKAGKLRFLRCQWDNVKGKELKTVIYHPGMKIIKRKPYIIRYFNKVRRRFKKLVAKVSTYAANK
jgi:hypothetical protein